MTALIVIGTLVSPVEGAATCCTDRSGRSRTLGVIDHIRKELREIEADPADVKEWIDVVILALDGAWRAGYEPQQIIDALVTKQAKNEARAWPDWRTMRHDEAIEHVRSAAATVRVEE